MDETGAQPDAPADSAPSKPLPAERPVPAGLVPISLVLIVATLVSLLIANARGVSASADDEATEAGQQDIEFIEPAASAADGGELKIEEHGYSMLTDLSDDDLITWGAVVTNTSRKHAVSAGVVIEAKDPSGDSIFDESSSYAAAVQTPLLLPGESIGVGTTGYPEKADVAQVKFEIAEPQWWPTGEVGETERGAPQKPVKFKVSDIEIGWEGQGQTDPYWTKDGVEAHTDSEGDMVARFKVDTDAKTIIEDPGVSALFRDDDGKILGATDAGDFDVWAEFPPGWSEQTLKVKYGPPEGVDESKVEIYPYAGMML